MRLVYLIIAFSLCLSGGGRLAVASETPSYADNLAEMINAELAVKRNQTASAANNYLDLAKHSSDPSLAKRATQIAISSGNIEQALEAAQLWIEREPQDPQALASYALLALQVNQIDNALKAVDQALKLNPAWDAVIALRIQILLEKKDPDQAIAYFQAVLKTHPNKPNLRLLYAELLANLGNHKAAQQQLNQLTSIPGYRSKAYLLLAQIALHDQQLSQAARYLRKASLDPQYANIAFFFLGNIAELQHQAISAMHWYNNVTNGPYFVKAHIRIAALLVLQGKYNEAHQHLDSLLVYTAAARKEIALADAAILIEDKQPQKAIAELSDTLRLLPNDPDLLYARSMASAQLSLWDNVAKDLRLILKQKPNHVDALNALGYLLADQQKDFQQALTYINRALKLDPQNPAILDSMGWIQYHLGNYNLAIHYLQRAIAHSHDSEIAAHLGEVLWKKGDHAAAKKVWMTALQKTPRHALLIKTIKRFLPSSSEVP